MTRDSRLHITEFAGFSHEGLSHHWVIILTLDLSDRPADRDLEHPRNRDTEPSRVFNFMSRSYWTRPRPATVPASATASRVQILVSAAVRPQSAKPILDSPCANPGPLPLSSCSRSKRKKKKKKKQKTLLDHGGRQDGGPCLWSRVAQEYQIDSDSRWRTWCITASACNSQGLGSWRSAPALSSNLPASLANTRMSNSIHLFLRSQHPLR